MSNKLSNKTAAFYDVDGTLISTNIVHTYAYYAMNSSTLRDKLSKTVSLVASLPLYWALDKYDRKAFNDIFYGNYAGFTEDRLVVLGEDIFEKVIRPNIYDGAQSLIKRSADLGYRQVLITGSIDVIMAPLAKYLNVDKCICNSLEIKDGIATGRLNKPIVAGATKALIMRRYAEKNNLDLGTSFAYADSSSDIPLLSVVGNPCAVNPDFGLRTAARSFDWPVLNLT